MLLKKTLKINVLIEVENWLNCLCCQIVSVFWLAAV